jgi:hypothetical protein
MSYRGRIIDHRQARYLVIEQISTPYEPTITIARIALTGRGTWAELTAHLTAHGLVAREWKMFPGAGEMRSMLDPAPAPAEPEVVAEAPAPAAPAAVEVEAPALFDRAACTQLRGQLDIVEAIAEAERDAAAAARPEPEPAEYPDGALFALRLTTETADGALFGLTV